MRRDLIGVVHCDTYHGNPVGGVVVEVAVIMDMTLRDDQSMGTV